VLVLPGVGFSSQIQPSPESFARQLICKSCACTVLDIAVSGNPKDKIRIISVPRWRFLNGILDSRFQILLGKSLRQAAALKQIWIETD
jgi:hypothetical protein